MKSFFIIGRYLLISAIALIFTICAAKKFRHEIECRVEADSTTRISIYYATERDAKLSEKQKLVLDESRSCLLPGDTIQIRVDVPQNKVDDSVTIFIGGNRLPKDVIRSKALGVYKTYEVSDKDIFRQTSERIDVGMVAVYFFMVLLFLDLSIRSISAWPHQAFVILVLLVLLFPALKISRREIDLDENRTLQKFPAYATFDFSNPSIFFKQVELAYGDRFNCRKTMVQLRDRIKWAFDWIGNGKTFVGKEGWFFLNVTLPDRRFRPFSTCEQIEQYLNSIDAYAKKRGKRFVFLIAPDKSRVYEDKLGVFAESYLERESHSFTDMVVSQLCSRCVFPVIYPRDELKRLRRECPCDLYWKYDTHWNWQGTYLGGYVPIIRALGKADSCQVTKWIDKPSHVVDFDLAKTFAYLPVDDFAPQPCKIPVFAAGNDPIIKILSKNKSGQPAVIDTFSSAAQGSLFCLRDSFMQVAVPYYARSFAQGRFVWRQQVELSDKEWLDRADVILLEIVERNLSRLGTYKFPKELN